VEERKAGWGLREGEGEGGRNMPQTLYVHMNKRNKFLKVIE
jgi:hypothetical protein